MAQAKRILIIGSNSFSGVSFAAFAIKSGWHVYGVSRSSESNDCYLPYKWLEPDQRSSFSFHQFNLQSNAKEIAKLVDENDIPYVVNFAALGMVAESWLYPIDYYKTNLIGNISLHEALRKIDCLKKYVHVSTPEVYGNTDGLLTESSPLNPSTPYATSRAACDIHLKNFQNEYGFPVVWTRAANVFGPGQQPFRIIPRVILCHRLGQKLQLHGGGSSGRSFIHIDDVASATLRIMENSRIGESYHLSTNRFVSIKEIAELICQRLKIDLNEIAEIAPERPGKDHAYLLDSSKCREHFDWRDERSLEEGIDETISWIDHWLDTIKEQPLHYTHKA